MSLSGYTPRKTAMSTSPEESKAVRSAMRALGDRLAAPGFKPSRSTFFTRVRGDVVDFFRVRLDLPTGLRSEVTNATLFSMKPHFWTPFPLVLAFCLLVVLGGGCTTCPHSQPSAVRIPDLPDLSEAEGSFYRIAYRVGNETTSINAMSLHQQGDWIVTDRSYPSAGLNGIVWSLGPTPLWLRTSEVISIRKYKSSPPQSQPSGNP